MNALNGGIVGVMLGQINSILIWGLFVVFHKINLAHVITDQTIILFEDWPSKEYKPQRVTNFLEKPILMVNYV
jgi:hypothetical protein